MQPERLADAWAIDTSVRDRAEPTSLRAVLAATADLWVESFADADAIDVRLAAGRLLPVLFDFHAEATRLCPLPLDVRTGLAGTTESVTVKRGTGESVTIRFGGIAKVAERDETVMVPGGPPGSPPRPITSKVTSTYRFARLDGNSQVFAVSAERLTDLFVSTNSLTDTQVARFARDEVREIAISPTGQPGVNLTLTKGNPKAIKVEEQQDRWFIDAKPNPQLADTARVNELLDQLGDFRASGPDRVIYPSDLQPIQTRITIVTRDKRPDGDPDGPAREMTLLIGKPDFTKRRFPVQLAGWQRVTLADDLLGPDEPDAWVSALLFPKTISELLDRSAITYRNRRLFDAAAELTSVSVADRFVLKRDPDEWKLTAPITSDADPGKAGQLGSSLANLTATDYLIDKPTADDVIAFGLNTPAQTVRLDFKDGRGYTLELGAVRPGRSEVFARLDKGAIFGLPISVVEQLTTGVVALLPLKVWAVPPEKIVSLEVARTNLPAESFKLARVGENWMITGPFAAPAPPANALQLASTLGNLSAVRYQSLSSANAAEFGFDKPLLALKIAYTEKKSPATEETAVAMGVIIGGLTPDGVGRYARLDSPNAPVFVVPDTVVTATQTPPLELLDRTLLSLDTRDSQGRIVSESRGVISTREGREGVEGRELHCRRRGSHFRLTFAAATACDETRSYGDDVKWADYGLEMPSFTIELTLDGEKPQTHTIAIGKPDSLGGRYARVDNGKAVAIIPTAAVDSLTRKKLEYADRTMLTFDPTTVVGLARKQGKDELELAPAATLGWDIVKPAKQKADQPFVDELADALSRLRADRVAAHGKKVDLFKQYGLEPASSTIAITIGDKAEQKTLRIGNYVDSVRLDSERYAAIDSPDAEVIVGVLPATLVNKLLAPEVAFRDRTLAKFVDADKAILERGGRKITFAKAGIMWKVTEPISSAAESAELEALIADLGKAR